MRLSSRLVAIAALTVLVGGSAAGCTGNSGAASSSGKAKRHTAAAANALAEAGAPFGPQSQANMAAAPSIRVVGAPQGVLAKEGILADAATGQVLWKRDPDTERPMASITKVMTAYLVIRAGNLNRKIKVPGAVLDYESKYGASSDGLNPGEVLTVHELLDGLLIESGADAAYTLATVYGPGLGAFVAKMNAAAREMGMKHTHFASPDGLPYPTGFSTYSTSADLLILGSAAMKSPVFRSIVDRSSYGLPKGQGHGAYLWNNSNELIGSYQGAIGIKTGYTDDAGHCLLFEATRNGRPLIGAVLDSPLTGAGAAAQDASLILNWGFALPAGRLGVGFARTLWAQAVIVCHWWRYGLVWYQVGHLGRVADRPAPPRARFVWGFWGLVFRGFRSTRAGVSHLPRLHRCQCPD
jgi:serine-type D-Ala-D-Ala carboxypeptidase (penicillin-binding protein 5/6)